MQPLTKFEEIFFNELSRYGMKKGVHRQDTLTLYTLSLGKSYDVSCGEGKTEVQILPPKLRQNIKNLGKLLNQEHNEKTFTIKRTYLCFKCTLTRKQIKNFQDRDEEYACCFNHYNRNGVKKG